MTVIPKDRAARYQILYDKGANKGAANKQGREAIKDGVEERQMKAVNCGNDCFDERKAPLSIVDVTANNLSPPF